MKGRILHFDAAEGGLIRGSDEQRYSFPATEWKGDAPPPPGQNVDFEIVNGAASGVYPVPVQLETPAPFQFGPFLADRSGLPFAAVILIACMLPFVSLGFVSPNLFDLVGFTSMIGNFSPGSDGSVQVGLYLFYLLYIVPVLAVLVVVQELRRAAGMGLRICAGLFCLVAPFAIVIGATKLVGAGMPHRGPDFDLVSHISLGWILIAAGGLGLIAVGLGWSPFGPGRDDNGESAF